MVASGKQKRKRASPELGLAYNEPLGSASTITGLIFGVLCLAGLVTFILHFSDVRSFVETVRAANPLWLGVAFLCQVATYFCAAAVWSRVLKKAGSPRAIMSLVRLAFVELFANQAAPTAGLSGTIMVVHGLNHRGITPAIAITALLVAVLSYYAAYALVAILAFVLLWYIGDSNNAWVSLLIIFLFIMSFLIIAILVLTHSRGGFIPATALHWRPVARLSKMLKLVRFDILRDGYIIFEAIIYQSAIFFLDAATLWCTAQSVGMSLAPEHVFISFLLASIVATFSPIPMGLGTFEGTCIGMLHFFGGSLETSLAATLILRGFTLWLPMLPGLWMIRREGKLIKTATVMRPLPQNAAAIAVIQQQKEEQS